MTALLAMYFYVPVLFFIIGSIVAFIVLGNLAGKLSQLIDGRETK